MSMKIIYLDNAACTPVDPRVVEAMLPYLKDNFGNPTSLHDIGQKAKKDQEIARGQVANLIKANPDEIIFTSGGTESNNLALKGVAWAYQSKGNHIITSQVEHHSVINACKALEKTGFMVTYLPVDKYGLVDPNEVKKAINDKTILVSIMQANGEVGTIEPIAEIAKYTKEKQILFHTDAVASAGQIEVNVKELGVDLLSLAGSQFYGPKGSGALFLKKGVRITPLFHGGIQENGRRAGTDNMPAIIGLGKAAEIAKNELKNWQNYLQPLRDKLIKGLSEKIPNLYLNGHPNNRLPNNVNVSIEFIEGESMLLFLNMEGIMVSSGSSCTSPSLKVSPVLTAMGINPAIAQGSLLFSLGKENTFEDIDLVLEKLPPIVERLRQMSPLYPVKDS